MADIYITDRKPFENKVKLRNGKRKISVDITDIFLRNYSIRYKVEYTDKSGKIRAVLPKISFEEVNGEVIYLISFEIPDKNFNIIQYRIDEFGYEKEIYYSFPIEIIRE